MTDADRDKLEGKFDQAKGEAKDRFGGATGDDDTQAEGKADKGEGKAKEGVGKAKNAVSEGLNKLTGDKK